MSSRYFDQEGRPITVDDWMLLFSDNQIARDEEGDIAVSTIYLGLNHNWDDGPPLIFETMVFGLDDNTEYQWRYSTKEAALAGHAGILEAVRAGDLSYDLEVPTT